MKKTSKALLWSSFILGIIYLVALIPCWILGFVFTTTKIEVTNLLAYFMIEFIRTGIPVLIGYCLAIIMLVELKVNANSIFSEVLTLILFCGVFGLADILFGKVATLILGGFSGAGMLVGYAGIHGNMGYVNFLIVISRSLLMMGACFSIAYKKLILPIVAED